MTNTSDDVFFSNALKDRSFPDYLSMRYELWTSRLLIESVLITIVHHPLLWKIMDTAMVVITAIAISKLTPSSNERTKNIFIVLLILLYPFIHMSSAGWVATTINYVWPLAFALVALIPLKKYLYQEKIRWWEYIIYIPSLLFAANTEQICALFCGVYFVFFLYLLYKKQFHPFIAIQLALSLLSMLFILTCPGNDLRFEQEITTWFPEFADLSFFHKLEIGFSSSLYHFMMQPNLIFLTFCALIFGCVFLRKLKSPLILYIAGLPLAAALIFGMFGVYFGSIFPVIASVKNALTPLGTGVFWEWSSAWIPDLILSGVSCLIIFSLYHCFENKNLAVLNIFIILVGFCTRLAMSFSPTIWASSNRTFIFMYFAIILSSVFLGSELYRLNKKRFWYICCILTIFSALMYLDNLYHVWL
jgi:hypothetical protein